MARTGRDRTMYIADEAFDEALLVSQRYIRETQGTKKPSASHGFGVMAARARYERMNERTNKRTK